MIFNSFSYVTRDFVSCVHAPNSVCVCVSSKHLAGGYFRLAACTSVGGGTSCSLMGVWGVFKEKVDDDDVRHLPVVSRNPPKLKKGKKRVASIQQDVAHTREVRQRVTHSAVRSQQKGVRGRWLLSYSPASGLLSSVIQGTDSIKLWNMKYECDSSRKRRKKNKEMSVLNWGLSFCRDKNKSRAHERTVQYRTEEL